MHFAQHEPSLDVENFDLAQDAGHAGMVEKKKHGVLLPNSIRCIIAGPSNCGKTNVVLSLLTHANGLKFENIYVYSKTLNQPKYMFLERCVSQVKGMGYFPHTDNTDIVRPQEAKPNSVFVFDDIACDKQDCIRQYFSMGRHNCIDCFYLCQTYARIPKHLIRDNANLIVIFKQDDMNLRHVYNDHVNTDMSFELFKQVCRDCWKTNYGFIVIDKDSELLNGRYRKEFSTFLKNNTTTNDDDDKRVKTSSNKFKQVQTC